MGFLSSLVRGLLGNQKSPRVRYRPSKHDKMKKWAKSKPQSFWDGKKR